ncbi:hypothetical protein Tco_1221816, partial [Tanacetum coccineum]
MRLVADILDEDDDRVEMKVVDHLPSDPGVS